MVQEVEAVYENGVLRPLSPVRLAESETVHVRISTNHEGRSQPDIALIDRARAEMAGRSDVPSLEEVRRMLATNPDGGNSGYASRTLTPGQLHREFGSGS